MNENGTNDGKASTLLRLVETGDSANILATKTDAWKLEPHVCKICFGRMASRPADQGLVELLCTNCGDSSKQKSVVAACCCSIVMRKRNSNGRSGGSMIDAGIRCVPNPSRSSAFPSIYIAQEVIRKTPMREISKTPDPDRFHP